MVEDVVQFPTQLQVTALALKRDVLEERDVPVVRARQPDDVFWRVTEISSGRSRESWLRRLREAADESAPDSAAV